MKYTVIHFKGILAPIGQKYPSMVGGGGGVPLGPSVGKPKRKVASVGNMPYGPLLKSRDGIEQKVTGSTLMQNELKNRFMRFPERLEHSFRAKSCFKDCFAARFCPQIESIFHGKSKNVLIKPDSYKFKKSDVLV